MEYVFFLSTTFFFTTNILFLSVPEHPRELSPHGPAILAPGGRLGGDAEGVQVPSAGLHPQLGHRRPRPLGTVPDQDAGPPVRRPGGQGAGHDFFQISRNDLLLLLSVVLYLLHP